MPPRRTGYPWVPRSNAHLEPGEFWSIPLRDGRFACGVVLGVPRGPDGELPVVNTRAFLGGLLAWTGDEPPTPEAIDRAAVVAQGFVHVRTILETGGAILGRAREPVRPLRWRSPGRPGSAGGPGWVYEGIARLRPATAADAAMPVMVSWGFGYMRELASRASEDPGVS